MSKAIIKLGSSCNSNCLFCHAAPKRRHKDLSTKEIKKKIIGAKKLGVSMVLMSGGEPTIRRDIFDIARFIKSLHLKLGLLTNARMLQSRDFLERLHEYNLKYLYISLHGSTAKINNKITKSEGFNQTMRGIRNASSLSDIDTIINCVVTNYNIKDLKNIVDLLKNFRIKKIKFSFVEPIPENDFGIVPDIETAAKKVTDAIRHAGKKGLNASIDGFPLCFIKGYEGRIDNLKTNNIAYISEVWECNFFSADEGNKIKLNECNDCKKKDECEGIYEYYTKKREIAVKPY